MLRGHHFSIFFVSCLFIITSSFSFPTNSSGFHGFTVKQFPRRILLHQPLFPATTLPSSLPPTPPPPPPPPPSNPSGFPDPDEPFYPEVPQGPTTQDQSQQPSPINGTAVTAVTHPDPIQPQPIKPVKKVAIAVSVVIVTLGMLSALAFYICKHRAKHPDESQKLVGSTISRDENGEESRLPPSTTTTSTFLYIGTVEPPSSARTAVSETNDFNGSPYRKLNSVKRNDRYRPSPDLQPLPPLTKQQQPPPPPPPGISSTPISSSDEESHHENAFYTPHGSSLSNDEDTYTLGSRHGNTSINFINGGSVPIPRSKRSSPPQSRLSFSSSDIKPPQPLPPTRKKEFHIAQSVPYAPRKPKFSKPPPPPDFARLQQLNNHGHEISKASPAPPPPPPPPPPPVSLPPKLIPPKKDNIVMVSSKAEMPQSRIKEISTGKSSTERNGGDDIDGSRPKLKSLHWDKVRATSNRATVWDQLKSSSFQLNEDMMESLFGCDSVNMVPKEAKRKSILPSVEQENRVLDPKKSQNIAIMLRALNVTREEVSEALLDGNPEGLGQELLETLVKMAPTKEEEIKLRDYNGDTSRLGPAERFLKAILDVPFAFKRVEAMLYRANFDAEIKYLMTSFQTLEDASEELKNSRLFLKLLEAVLRAGNRMNVGTTRGDALAFKLDTLLKLADVKGTDGKTTLLHFVVQEIIRLEGAANGDLINKPSSGNKDEEFRKQGLQVVGGLSRELDNVKKAAAMDSDVLSSYVTKLEKGLEKVTMVLQYEKPSMQSTFFESMKKFVKEAEEKIRMVKAEEQMALSSVKEVTEYFHGDAAKEEAHPFRIFMVVRDFLSIVDNVCKEVGKMRDSSMGVGTARSFRMPPTTSLPVLSRYQMRHEGSSDDDSSL